ncbi:MAG: trypsin-like peptidase domain-containing protein [Gammaproteobacteria bacterium]|nr:trypsin-like peptidase domain-containing protein [Gammaproteobacteria bacterium]
MFSSIAYKRHSAEWTRRLAVILALCAGPSLATAAALAPEQVALIKEATFEVIVPKPDETGITYDQPINFDLLPYAYRKDKFIPIGTAFAVPNGLVMTAAHVLGLEKRQMHGIPKIRDAKGVVYEIDRIVKYSYARDFVVFTLKSATPGAFLATSEAVKINETVFAVGNALGQGIVIRDGNYTSDTPEDRNGEWSWIRFSAAASPGNSGGPLLDKDGKVAGIVVAKSPNENLNYALPVNEVLKAPANLAALKWRATYRLPNMDFLDTDEIDLKIDLPLSAAELKEKLLPRLEKFHDGQLAALLVRNREELFPQGAGSRKLLATTLNVSHPAVIGKGADGDWTFIRNQSPQSSDLGANGVLDGTKFGDFLLLRLRKPDNITLNELLSDSKQFMDLLLKAMPVQRQIGSETRRVKSLGSAADSRILRDRYGRAWRAQIWNIPFLNRQFIAYSTPTPEGMVTMMAMPSVEMASDFDRDMKALTDFLYVSYHGTVTEWQTFLSLKEQMPDPLRSLALEYSGASVSLKSDQFALACGPECLAITPKSLLSIGFSFNNEAGRLGLRIAAAGLRESINSENTLALSKVLRPPEDLNEAFRKDWLHASARKTPFDGEPVFERGRTVIMRPLARSGDAQQGKNADANSLFVAYYSQAGEQNKEDFKRRYSTLLGHIAVFP